MTTIRLRGRIDIHTTDGHLTDADVQRAWHATGDIAAGCPIDIHIHGRLRTVASWAFTPLGRWLADAPEVVLHTSGGQPNDLHAAVERAIALGGAA